MGIEINKEYISSIDNSLNVYQQYIDDVDTSMTNLNIGGGGTYESELEEKINHTFNINDSIYSDFKKLNFSTSISQNDIANMDISYNNFLTKLEKSNTTQSDLKNMISKYDAIDATLKNSQRTNIQHMMIVWGVIFLFVAVALFFSIIEDKKEMNIFSKFLIFIFLLIILFYSISNFRIYIERNIQ